jgi:predicted nucleotidyltransferase/DNA-binding XRE family transcriptional regulator
VVGVEKDTTASASLLCEARVRGRLTQTDVARRAGVAQSVVSAYESGRREPALSTLIRLVASTGHRLVFTLEPEPGARPGLPDTPHGRRLRQRRTAVLDTVARHGASNVRVFGSVARGEDGPGSDIDLLVDMPPGASLIALGTLERDLAKVLGVRVDLVPADGLKPKVRVEAETEAIPL